ncbi:hypothetical protein CLV92_101563 [Kineococcus xinjiangensis]|uniref:Parallel beta helix pectate lyase-like protein n=2 Tax=Kineococcus xinjiangensis TaxID=512762 RepID=A0A2S6IWX8_9ACTN|nr:hypothetical protein CLV92_101563 [Kineococcus xinjiangensis]
MWVLSGPSALAAEGPEILHLWLVDATTDTRLVELEDYQTIDLAFAPEQLSVEAEVDSETGSVVFELGYVAVRTENVAPYALNGDAAGDIHPHPALSTPGWITVGAQPFAQDAAGGAAGAEVVRNLYLRQPDFVVSSTADRRDAWPGDGSCRAARPGTPASAEAAPPDSGPDAPASRLSTLDAVGALPEATPTVRPGRPPFRPLPVKRTGCALRAALEEANALPGRQTISVDGRVGPYLLTLGELRITDDVALHGHERPVVDAELRSRVLSVSGTAADEPIVDVDGVDLANGRVGTSDRGGVLHVEAALLQLSNSVVRGGSANFGGGIYLQSGGDLTLTRSVVRGNSAGHPESFRGGGFTQRGGGISNLGGHVVVRSSAVVDNVAVRGGGISNFGGTLRVENSTVAGNEAKTHGGGMENRPNAGAAGVLHVSFSTIAHNRAGTSPHAGVEDRGGGGVYNRSTAFIASSVLARNTDPLPTVDARHAPDCYSPQEHAFTSFRGNVVGVLSATCDLGDYSWGDTRFLSHGTPGAPLDPGLAPFRSDSPLPHYELLAGSVAVDVGARPDATLYPCPDLDVRDRPRPVGASCDAGSVERG